MAKIETLRDLELAYSNNACALNIIKMMTADTWDELADCVEEAINLALRSLAENPELKGERSEDELTIDLVQVIRGGGFDAGHENKVGGHVDIVVRGRDDFLWLGEAKWHRNGYDWLYKGFQQLNTRYATASPGQDRGGVVIYVHQENTTRVMERWQRHLSDKHSGIEFAPCKRTAPGFFSKHPHDRTGRPYRVKHFAVSLHFEPKDSNEAVSAASASSPPKENDKAASA